MKMRNCVTTTGEFIYGIHKPDYKVSNLRKEDRIEQLGIVSEKSIYDNRANFPSVDVLVSEGDWVFEIPNAFPFRGVTYINKSWADRKAKSPDTIYIEQNSTTSFVEAVKEIAGNGIESKDLSNKLYKQMPVTVLLALATTSSEPDILSALADLSCELMFDKAADYPIGMRYQTDEEGKVNPVIYNSNLFEALVNNEHLPDSYKEVMVLRPGTQGSSEIVGEWQAEKEIGLTSHVFEYLRRNSYIPWGHYAANMANDSIRYQINDLTEVDMSGLRHLYYQRTYVRLAEELGVPVMARWKSLLKDEIEELREKVAASLIAQEAGFSSTNNHTRFVGTIWGWNFGFDLSASGYRLHASHQQIHQQFAMVPDTTVTCINGTEQTAEVIEPFSCGDMITDYINAYRQETGNQFFSDYITAVKNNKRMDGKDDANVSLVVYEDENVMLFVPKAQTSQWELQLVTLGKVGNILEADTKTRVSLDKAILKALQILNGMGARMVTTVEYAKRFTSRNEEELDLDQRLLYVFLPKLPYSPGGFSEAQSRWISGHYPEDFAAACRAQFEPEEAPLLEIIDD